MPTVRQDCLTRSSVTDSTTRWLSRLAGINAKTCEYAPVPFLSALDSVSPWSRSHCLYAVCPHPGRNDAVEKGGATVPVAPVGVPPNGLSVSHTTQNDGCARHSNVFGGTPKTPGETPGPPEPTASFRPSRNDAAERGDATVPVAPVGVPPTGLGVGQTTLNGACARHPNVFGGTPKTPGETPGPPKPAA